MELARNLKIESVERLEPTAPHQIEADVRVAQAVERLREARVGCLLVTQDGKLVGIFTERDLLTRVVGPGLPLSMPLRECMTPNPVSVGSLDPIRTAILKMQDGGYRHLPVVDAENRPIGILSVKRIIRHIVEHFPHVVYNQPPGPTAREREGA
ncbi:MAG: CBS domain-containing protein [Fimbriiglobus sp.]